MKKKPRKHETKRDGAFPSLKTTPPGHWIQVQAGDEEAASGGGRRSVLTEVMVVPGGRGWLVRTLVSSPDAETVALCFVPKR
jgi:hypothetical protein